MSPFDNIDEKEYPVPQDFETQWKFFKNLPLNKPGQRKQLLKNCFDMDLPDAIDSQMSEKRAQPHHFGVQKDDPAHPQDESKSEKTTEEPDSVDPTDQSETQSESLNHTQHPPERHEQPPIDP